MSTRRCPSCGEEYLATVTSCADCDIALLPPGAAPPAAGAAGWPDDVELVGYDLDDWTPEQRAELAAALASEGIHHEWEDGELVVAEGDADVAEELIDGIDHPDALDPEDDGDDAPAELLSALYVASDVLAGDPRHSVAVTELLEAAAATERVGRPYGVDPATWSSIEDGAEALAALLGGEGDDEEVMAAARTLRDALRPLV